MNQHDDLLAVHNKIIKWKDDPLSFVREVFGAEPDKWQREALELMRDHNKLAIRSGHGVGKSTFLSWLLLWFISTRYPVKIPCTAPTANQLVDILGAEVRLWLRKMPPVFADQFKLTVDRIELIGGRGEAFAVFRTARKENPEALQGFHSENLLFLIDEGSGVEEVIFEVARGALSTPSAKVVMTGNPTRTSGYFFDAFNSPTSIYKKMHVSCLDSAFVSQEWIEDMAASYNRDSNIFRVRVLGEFPTEEADVLIPYDHVESACGRDIDPTGMPVIWGLDVARYGSDDTVLIKRADHVVTEPPIILSQKSTMEVVGFVKNLWDRTMPAERPDSICVDVIGMGAGVVDRLSEQNIPAYGVNTAEQPRALIGEANRLRDELWLEMAKWFATKSVSIPEIEGGGTMDKRPMARLVSELTGLKKGFTSSGKIRVESKDDMKKRLGRSPDMADALALTFAEQYAMMLGESAKYASNSKTPIRRNLGSIV